MKKVFMSLAVVALMLATASCACNNQAAEATEETTCTECCDSCTAACDSTCTACDSTVVAE